MHYEKFFPNIQSVFHFVKSPLGLSDEPVLSNRFMYPTHHQILFIIHISCRKCRVVEVKDMTSPPRDHNALLDGQAYRKWLMKDTATCHVAVITAAPEEGALYSLDICFSFPQFSDYGSLQIPYSLLQKWRFPHSCTRCKKSMMIG